MAKTVYIVSAVRTPIGKFGGMLAELTQPDLGTIAVRAALERAFGLPLPREQTPGEFSAPPSVDLSTSANGTPWHVDEVIFGNARLAGVGPNPARQIAWRAPPDCARWYSAGRKFSRALHRSSSPAARNQ